MKDGVSLVSDAHVYTFNIYYEDTDLTGAVYHANYLAYFERAREHCLGIQELVRMYREDGIGFVVHHVDLTYRAPSFHGDELEIHTRARCESEYRIIFEQHVRGRGESTSRVIGRITLVCVNRDHQLITLPPSLRVDVERRWDMS